MKAEQKEFSPLEMVQLIFLKKLGGNSECLLSLGVYNKFLGLEFLNSDSSWYLLGF